MLGYLSQKNDPHGTASSYKECLYKVNRCAGGKKEEEKRNFTVSKAYNRDENTL